MTKTLAILGLAVALSIPLTFMNIGILSLIWGWFLPWTIPPFNALLGLAFIATLVLPSSKERAEDLMGVVGVAITSALTSLIVLGVAAIWHFVLGV